MTTRAILQSMPFQLGYVVRDFDSGIAFAGQSFGIEEFKLMRNLSGNARNVALAYASGIMIELIEPRDRVNGIYASAVPAGLDAMMLHHIGYIVSDEQGWADACHRLDGHDIPVVAQGEVPGVLRFLYADTRPLLGHFVEYIFPLDDVGSMFDSVPGDRRPVQL